jgi:molybdate transport system ATP-binding protein
VTVNQGSAANPTTPAAPTTDPVSVMGLQARVGDIRGSLTLAVDIDVPGGTLVAVLGPNGSGKTTLLRCLAGLRSIRSGLIEIDGTAVDDPEHRVFTPPEQRSVGFVFQEPLLFPHLTVLDNVAFGLRHRGAPATDARRHATTWLERLGIEHLRNARSRELSGGQAQRVALARALAPEPRVLLLDEPFSSLDAAARLEMRRALRGALDGFTGATVLVTHDPVEALSLADRVVILERGAVVQADAPYEVAARPRSAWIASLVGVNLWHGTTGPGGVTIDPGSPTVVAADSERLPAGTRVSVVVHPHAVALYDEPPRGSPRNAWPMTVVSIERHASRVRVGLDGPLALVAEVTASAAAEAGLGPGVAVWAVVKATEVEIFED